MSAAVEEDIEVSESIEVLAPVMLVCVTWFCLFSLANLPKR